MLYVYCDEYDFSKLSQVFEGEYLSNCDLAAEVVFVDEQEIRRLNREMRGVDAVTDVLSFPSIEQVSGGTEYRGFSHRNRRGGQPVFGQHSHMCKTRKRAGGRVRAQLLARAVLPCNARAFSSFGLRPYD